MKSSSRKARLNGRRDDYDKMVTTRRDKNDWRGYRKPGSNKK